MVEYFIKIRSSGFCFFRALQMKKNMRWTPPSLGLAWAICLLYHWLRNGFFLSTISLKGDSCLGWEPRPGKNEYLGRHLPELVNGLLFSAYMRPTPRRKLHGKHLVLSWQGEHPRGCEEHRPHTACCASAGLPLTKSWGLSGPAKHTERASQAASARTLSTFQGASLSSCPLLWGCQLREEQGSAYAGSSHVCR